MTEPIGVLSHATTGTLRGDELAALGYLARYSGKTYEHYRVVLKILFDWCAFQNIAPLQATRPILELFGRYLEQDRNCCPSTVAGHLTVVRGFYSYAEIDGYVTKSPATYLRRPRVFIDESSQTSLERHEFAAVLSAAQASNPHEWALITLLGLLGLRISEALNVRIEDYQGTERGHRVLKLVGKGGKPATMPLPVPVLRALDAASDDRADGPLLLRPATGEPMNRRSAEFAIKRLCKRVGVTRRVTPHTFRHTMITLALDAGVPLRDVQRAARHSDPRITERYDRRRQDHDRHAIHVLTAYVAGAAA